MAKAPETAFLSPKKVARKQAFRAWKWFKMVSQTSDTSQEQFKFNFRPFSENEIFGTENGSGAPELGTTLVRTNVTSLDEKEYSIFKIQVFLKN